VTRDRTGDVSPASPLRPTSGSTTTHWALGSVALLLLLVNLMTPALLNGFSNSGGFLGEGTLYVSATPGGELTFVVTTEGHVELARIVVALNFSAPNPPGNATTYRHWDRWMNSSDTVAASFNVSAPSFVVNVTAWYVNGSAGNGPNAPAATVGTFAFLVSGSGPQLSITVTPIYPLVGTGSLPEGGASSVWTSSLLPGDLALAQPPSTATGPAPALHPSTPFPREGA
jgi:hypothetical protein